MSFNQFLRNTRTNFSKNKPEIMTGVGLGGILISTVFFIKGTIKAVRKVDAYKKEHQIEKVSPKEVITLCWMDYLFPVTTLLLSGGLIIKSDQIKATETGELMALAALQKTLLTDYKETVKEVLDEKKVEEIEEKANKKTVEKILNDPDVEVFPTGYGNTLFIESLSGTVFRSSKDRVVQSFAEIERRIYFDNYSSVNEWRDVNGLRGHDLGELLGFNQSTNNGKIDYTLRASEYFGELCWVIEFEVEPIMDYNVVFI